MKVRCNCPGCGGPLPIGPDTKFDFDSHMEHLREFSDRLHRDLKELPSDHPRWVLYYRQEKEQLRRMVTPPTKEETEAYWAEQYRDRGPCKTCGHSQHEHWCPENFPMTVVCHVNPCRCEYYVPSLP